MLQPSCLIVVVRVYHHRVLRSLRSTTAPPSHPPRCIEADEPGGCQGEVGAHASVAVGQFHGQPHVQSDEQCIGGFYDRHHEAESSESDVMLPETLEDKTLSLAQDQQGTGAGGQADGVEDDGRVPIHGLPIPVSQNVDRDRAGDGDQQEQDSDHDMEDYYNDHHNDHNENNAGDDNDHAIAFQEQHDDAESGWGGVGYGNGAGVAAGAAAADTLEVALGLGGAGAGALSFGDGGGAGGGGAGAGGGDGGGSAGGGVEWVMQGGEQVGTTEDAEVPLVGEIRLSMGRNFGHFFAVNCFFLFPGKLF